MSEQKSSAGKARRFLSRKLTAGEHSHREILACAEQLIHDNEPEEALLLLSSVSESPGAGYWFLRGLVNQKLQQWGEAMNCYHHCLDMEPEHPGATAGLEICKGILDFWNPELFNP